MYRLTQNAFKFLHKSLFATQEVVLKKVSSVKKVVMYCHNQCSNFSHSKASLETQIFCCNIYVYTFIPLCCYGKVIGLNSRGAL